MTEEDAKSWIAGRCSVAQLALLERFAAIVLAESDRQNLISPATFGQIWNRHILDSAQLLSLAQGCNGSWVDIGSGAGFPGIVLAILTGQPMTLIEPRARRSAYLQTAAATLGLTNVDVVQAKAETATGRYDVVTARAVAALPALFSMTSHLRHAGTRMILPRGRNGATELQDLPGSWKGMFHVEQSLSDPESVIVVADGVST